MPLDQIDVDNMDEKEEQEMSFLEHLEELRWHIIRAFVSILVIAVGVIIAGPWIFEHIILAPKEPDFFTYNFFCGISESMCFRPPAFNLETRELGEQFIVHLKVSFILGIIVAFPYIFWEFWRFIKPGLYDKEQKAARGVVFVCSMLFAAGVLFGYYIISPFAITFLASYNVGAVSAPTLASFVNYMTMFTLPTGIVFQLPVLVYFLSKIGMVTPTLMRTYRKHAIVLILVMSAIITPPDVVTQFLISIPLYFLYEISIGISKRVTQKMDNED